MSQTIEKPALNEEFRICDFSTVLDAADTITTGYVVIETRDGVDKTADMISDISVYTGNMALRYKLKGGDEGVRYKMNVVVSTASVQKFSEPFIVFITQ